MSGSFSRWVLGSVLAAFVLCPGGATVLAQDADAQTVFDQRILPIFRSAKPSSCVQCHLSSVDLKEYILPSAEKTFVSLRDQGLVDLDHPENSKILQLIKMGEKDLDEGARLIHAKTRRAEYEAFSAWIKACAADKRLRSLPPLAAADRAGPAVPDEVIRHARKSRVVDAFARTIWSQRMRCFPCHTPFEIDPDNPRHQAALKTRRQIAAQFGQQKLDEIGFVRRTPQATLQFLIDRSKQARADDLPIINIDKPAESLLLLKPLAKLPPKRADGTFAPVSNRLPVTHGGGLKMHRNDPSYKAFLAWLIDYANVVQGRYQSVDELPADNWASTEYVLRISDFPERFAAGTTVQLTLHIWDEAAGDWSKEPIAFTQSVITPRRMVNGTLFMLLDQRPRAESSVIPELKLERGKYLIKVFVDQQGKLDKDPTLLLGADSYVGAIPLSVRRWRTGFKNAQTASAAALVRESQ